jgi:hypothetical protein
MVFGEFTFFADIHENELVATIHASFHFADVSFADARPGVVHNFQKAGRMLVGHENSFRYFAIRLNISPAASCLRSLIEQN